MNNTPSPQTFTEYFGLKIEQEKLEFVDIYARRDIPLFLDPYGISAMNTPWAKQCERHIAEYFQILIEAIQNGDRRTVTKLLDALHEVNEIALGFSENEPRGRGIGPQQAKLLQEAFENSDAAKSGDIRDIADCALLIPSINRDKISDITANILKRDLIEFTQQQCRKYKIPMRRVAVDNAFDFELYQFQSFHAELPVIEGRAKILLPITSVRRSPELDKYKYYKNFILEFLKAEHLHAGDSLSHVLKNGRLKIDVRALKNRYPMTADFIHKFSKENPQILEKYKIALKRSAKKPGTKVALHAPPKVLSSSERIRILTDINPGNRDASNYHKLIFNSLIHILGKRVSNPLMEKEINEKRKRIDIVFDNKDKEGFFAQLNEFHGIHCPKIIIECKNYGRELGNPEVDQLAGRLNKRRGLFGMLFCRSIEDKKLLQQRLRDIMHDDKGYILAFDDSELSILLKLKDANKEAEIDDFIAHKFDKLIM